VVFTAAEPNVRWKTFAGAIVAAARDIGSGLLVTLGAFLTDVPHTRPVPVVGSAVDEDTADRLGLARSQYEGPTGIVGVLHDAANRDGVPSVSLWAAVPHYLPAGPNPKASLALVRRTAALLDVEVDTRPLERAADAWEEGMVGLVQESEELSDYVSRLEQASDAPVSDEADDGGLLARGSIDRPLPSGDAIAAEVERFLREQGGPGGSS